MMVRSIICKGVGLHLWDLTDVTEGTGDLDKVDQLYEL